MVQIETTRGERTPEQQSFQQRFQQSLWQVPNRGFIFDYQLVGRRDNLQINVPGYSDWFTGLMQIVREKCLAEQVCDHSQPHVEQAAQNGLVFLDMVHDALPNTLDAHLFSDSAVVFTLLVHDIGYGSPDVRWENQYAIGHEEAGSRMITRFIETLPENSSQRQFLAPLLPSIVHAMSTDTDSREDIMATVFSAKHAASPEAIFSLLIMTADKVDYFRSGRIDAIPAPNTYAENPYYFLAWMVENYELVYDKEAKKIHYVVHLYGEDKLSFEDRQERLALWQKEIRTHFPYVLELLEGMAYLTGTQLVIEPGQEKSV